MSACPRSITRSNYEQKTMCPLVDKHMLDYNNVPSPSKSQSAHTTMSPSTSQPGVTCTHTPIDAALHARDSCFLSPSSLRLPIPPRKHHEAGSQKKKEANKCHDRTLSTARTKPQNTTTTARQTSKSCLQVAAPPTQPK